MAKALFLPTPFDLQDARHLPIANGMTINEWLDHSGMRQRMSQQPIVLMRDKEQLVEADWDEEITDEHLIVCAALPQNAALVAAFKAAVTWLGANWGYIAVFAAALALSYLMMPDFEEGNPADSNYNIQVRGNRAKLGSPKPVMYGTFRIYPDYCALPFVEFDARNEEIWTFLFECTLGDADVDQATMRFEDTLLSNFQDVRKEVLSPGQKSTLYPSSVIVSSEVSALDLDENYTAAFVANPAGASSEITRIGVDLLTPEGLYRQRSSGAQETWTVRVQFQSREIDDAGVAIGSWTDVGTVSLSGNSAAVQRKTYFYDVAAGRYEVRAKTTTAPLDETAYKIKDNVQWGQLRGYVKDDLPAPQSTRIALRMRSSDQIGNRALSKFNVILTRKLRSWSTGGGWASPAATNSIAWAFADAASASYGGNRADSYLDLTAIEDFENNKTPAGWECNGFIDTKMTVWDALQRICNCGLANGIDPNGVLTIKKDEASAAATQMFNMRNIVRGSFQISRKYVGDDTPDYVIAEFYDEDQDYRLTEIDCMLPGVTSNNPNKQRLWGVTNETQAWQIGMFLAAENYYRRALVEFETGLEARIPQYKDTIEVSHFMVGQEGYDQVTSDVTAYNSTSKILTLVGGGLTGRFTTPYVILKDYTGQPMGPYTCTVSADNQITITDSQFVTDGDSYLTFDPSDYALPTVAIGEGQNFSATVKVIKVEPSGQQTYKITGFIEEPSVYTITSGATQPSSQVLPALVDRTPTVSNLRATLMGTHNEPVVKLEWDGKNSDKYDIQFSVDGGSTYLDLDGPFNTIENYFIDYPEPGGTVRYRVAGISAYRGPWSSILAVDTTTLSYRIEGPGPGAVIPGVNWGSGGWNIQLIRNSTDGTIDSNAGEVWFSGGSYRLPNGTVRSISAGTVYTPFEATTYPEDGYAYIIWGATNPETRFSAVQNYGNLASSGLFCAVYDVPNQEWFAVSNTNNQVSFTPLATDYVVAQLTRVNSSTGLDNVIPLVPTVNDPSAGQSFSAAKIWNFDTTVESWTGTNATLAHQSYGAFRITPTTTDPVIRSPSGLSIDGGLNRYVRARVKLVSGATTSPQFAVFYVTSGHGESGSYFKSTADILSGTSDWVTIEWDMHNLTAGGTDWETSTITRIRLDFYQNSTTIVDVDWIAVGRKGQDGAYYTDDVVLNDNIAVSLVAEPLSAGWVSLDGGTSYDPSAATIDVAVQAISNGSQFATVTWTRSGANVSNATISGSGFTLQSFGSAATTKTLTVTHTASGETIDINASVVTTDVTGGAGK